MSSPLALVDTTLLNQYVHAYAQDGLLTVDSFTTLFSCDYSWIYRLAFGVYHYEISANQDYLALIQSASEDGAPKVLCNSISETFMQSCVHHLLVQQAIGRDPSNNAAMGLPMSIPILIL